MTETTSLRRCVGSAKFGIAAHEAPVEEFPAQRSQKDGLGRMCKTYWSQYTRAVRTGSLEAKAAAATPARTVPTNGAKPPTKVKAKAALAAAPRVRERQPGPAVGGRPTGEPRVAVAEEATAGEPTPEAEEDAILVERRQRVKAWRKSELEGTAPEA